MQILWLSCIISPASDTCRCDGIGRRSGLKIHRWRQRTGSSPVTGTTSPRTSYRSRRLFYKSHLLLILSRLLSKLDPFALGSGLVSGADLEDRPRNRSHVPARRKRYVACDELFHFIAKLIARSFCCFSFPNRTRFHWAVIWFWVQTCCHCVFIHSRRPRRSKVRFAPAFFMIWKKHSSARSLAPRRSDLVVRKYRF